MAGSFSKSWRSILIGIFTQINFVQGTFKTIMKNDNELPGQKNTSFNPIFLHYLGISEFTLWIQQQKIAEYRLPNSKISFVKWLIFSQPIHLL